MSWNVCEGLLADPHAPPRAGAPPALDHDRYRLLCDTIRAEQPDVLGLLELNGWMPETLRQFLADTGLQYGELFPSTTSYHLAIASRFPIEASRDLAGSQRGGTSPSWWLNRLSWHAMPAARIGGVDLIVAHLCPKLPQDRAWEWAVIHHHLRPATVVMGDLNAPRSAEHTAALHDQLTPVQRQKFGRAGCYSVADQLVACGWADPFVGQTGATTVPTATNLDPAHGTVPLRIDYCLVGPALASSITAARVLKTPSTDKISDHYPVVVTLTEPGAS